MAVSVLLYGCSHSSQSYWDDSDKSYHIPQANLRFNISESLAEWDIANPNELPTNILFCGVDNKSDICVMILDLSDIKVNKNVSELSSADIEDIVKKIADQPDDISVTKVTQLTPSKFLNSNAWRFDCVVTNIIAELDTISVGYSGYVFDGKSNLNSIVMTYQYTDLIGNDKIKLNDYLERLTRMDE